MKTFNHENLLKQSAVNESKCPTQPVVSGIPVQPAIRAIETVATPPSDDQKFYYPENAVYSENLNSFNKIYYDEWVSNSRLSQSMKAININMDLDLPLDLSVNRDR